MDGCLFAHMFPQELHTNIHELGSIQCGTAVLGVTCSMGRNALKRIFILQASRTGAGGNFVYITGMPAKGCIQISKYTFPGHEGLSRTAFFAGATIKYDCAGKNTGFNSILDRDCSAKGTGTQQVMSASVPVTTGHKAFSLGSICNLRKTGKSIIFC